MACFYRHLLPGGVGSLIFCCLRLFLSRMWLAVWSVVEKLRTSLCLILQVSTLMQSVVMVIEIRRMIAYWISGLHNHAALKSAAFDQVSDLELLMAHIMCIDLAASCSREWIGLCSIGFTVSCSYRSALIGRKPEACGEPLWFTSSRL